MNYHLAKLICWGLVLFACGGWSPCAAAIHKPNLILILIDDLGPEWISCYGADDIKTPHIDELARTGLLFHNAYSMPQCTPTRATLLTGQYPFRHGWVNHWDVPRWGAGCHFDPRFNMTFARQLKKARYATALAGKWQINDFRVQPGILKEHGFDEWCVWTGGEGNNPVSNKRYWDPFLYSSSHAVPGDGPSSNVRSSKFGVTGTYNRAFGPDLFNEFVRDFLRRHKNEPMMIYYPMVLTHTPFVTTPDEPDAAGALGRHKAMVRYVDRLVGQLTTTLNELGIRKRTILFLTTDNGTTGRIKGSMRGRTVRGGKAKLTENGVRQPFLVNCPGTVPVGETDCLTDFSDLLPTFCELAGAPLPNDVPLDGHSIAPVILGNADDGPRQWIMAMGYGAARLDKQGVRGVYDYNPRVVRDKRFKIHIDHQRRIHALYDLTLDPAEQNNLMDQTDAASRAALKKFQAVAATFPEKDARPRYDPLPPQPWDKKRSRND